ncbi:MAG: GNAT family N-acetyltransferase [Candidatus Thermoplasmatota archaeon]|nr:GNAT family N-acetyltransferase [Candidatus Thermoplasmatota archaeon]
MIYRLEKEKRKNVLSLYEGLHFTVAVNAIIEENRSGEIYVDNVEKPRSAFTVDIKGRECYLVGFSENDEFNSSVQKLIVEKIIPTLNSEFSVLHFFPDIWAEKIHVFLRNERPWKRYMLWFKNFKWLKINWQALMPAGFSVERIDEAFLRRVGLKNLDNVLKVVLNWNSFNDFLMNGYGLCLIHGNVIVSWCVFNRRAGNKCEIVIMTDEKHRNAGLATLMSAALLDYCHSKNLTPFWHCSRENFSSIVVAKKIGFKQASVYPVYYWIPRWYTYLRWILEKNPGAFVSLAHRGIQRLLFKHK